MRSEEEIWADVIEQLAELEHDQWCFWTQSLAIKLAPAETALTLRWKALWIPYCQLPEEEKRKDREWAEKAFDICMQTARILNDKPNNIQGEK